MSPNPDCKSKASPIAGGECHWQPIRWPGTIASGFAYCALEGGMALAGATLDFIGTIVSTSPTLVFTNTLVIANITKETVVC